jgi:DNA-directed RNA polymerase specialized sigma24 family protein
LLLKVPNKKDWKPTHSAFLRLLKWLDAGSDSGGETYVEIRRRLVRYFDRRNCVSPDELADETLNRVARRLEETDAAVDDTPQRYCYIVAKFVFLEYTRAAGQGLTSLDLDPAQPSTVALGPDVATQERERLLDCLERCLKKLPAADQELILEYYRGEQREKIENRKELGARLGLTANALTIRACRIRNKLELCVKSCCSEK